MPATTPDLVVQHLDHRHQAVGGAGGVGDHGVAALQHLVIHAIDDGRIDVLTAGRGDHHLLRAAFEVRAGLGLAGEEPGALEHVLDPILAPRQLRRVALGEHADAVAVHDHVVAVDLDFAGEPAVHGVVARQVRIRLRVAQIVERDDLQFPGALALVEGAQHVASDAPVTIDADLDCHCAHPSSRSRIVPRDIIGRKAKMREHVRALAGGAEAIDAEHAAGKAHVTPPALGRARLDREPAGHGRRQHAVAVRLVPARRSSRWTASTPAARACRRRSARSPPVPRCRLRSRWRSPAPAGCPGTRSARNRRG